MTAGRARALRPEFVKFLTYGNFSVETPSVIIWPIFSRKCTDRCSVATPIHMPLCFLHPHTHLHLRVTRAVKNLRFYFHTMRKYTHAHTICMRVINFCLSMRLKHQRVCVKHTHTLYTHQYTQYIHIIQAQRRHTPALIRVRKGARPIFYRSCTHNRRVQTARSYEVTAQPPIWRFFC